MSQTAFSASLNLAQNGKTNYVIALANDAIPAEKTAAEQFQKYFSQITGADIAIKAETAVAKDAPQILIGAGSRAKVLLPQQNWESLRTDGIIIRTSGNKLILAGGRPRGALYAVFQFLEDVAECRWWTPTESTIPHKSTFIVPEQNVNYLPPFSYREHFAGRNFVDGKLVYHPEFSTIIKENGDTNQQDKTWGGHYELLGFVHTFSKLLPPEKYFKEHPEWYSDPTNGNLPGSAKSPMPAAQNTQLCFSNSEMADEMTKQVLAWIEKNPDAGYISLSQNDSANYCRDMPSMELAEKEGSQAAPVIDFVNKIAAQVQKKYPHFLVETMAYLYSEKAPKTVRPAQNVIVRLAPIYADWGHPIDSDWNKDVRDNLVAWSKIAPRLFLWTYTTNFSATMLPYPNWDILDDNLRFFAAHNVTGVFVQGDNYTDNVGDFTQLRRWLEGHLLWNPQADKAQLISEFLRGYYGAAAPYLQQYLDLVQASFRNKNVRLSLYNGDYSFMDAGTIGAAQRLFAQAAAAVRGEKVLSQRVQRESLSLDALVFYKYNILKREAAAQNTAFPGPANPQAALQDFAKTAKSFGVHNWSDSLAFDVGITMLERSFSEMIPLPDFLKDKAASDVIDIQQNAFKLYPRITKIGIMEDAAASDGKAVYMGTNSDEWALQAHLGQFVENSSDAKWHVYAMVRADVAPGMTADGAAFVTGIYDVPNKKNFAVKGHALANIVGDVYKPIDLGTHALNGGMYIYFVPGHRPNVDKTYIDRILLVKE